MISKAWLGRKSCTRAGNCSAWQDQRYHKLNRLENLLKLRKADPSVALSRSVPPRSFRMTKEERIDGAAEQRHLKDG